MAFVCLFTVVTISSCNKDETDDEKENIENNTDINTDINNDDCVCSANDKAIVLKVGVDKQFKTIKEASVAAQNNTIIEIDAGTYKGDAALAFWKQDSIVIRASGGEVNLDADGKSMEDKAIWVIDGGNICIEGITFVNAKVPDQNGAGIRLTNGNLTVINCRFLHNEMGLLTGNFASTTLTVKNSEFGYSGYGDGLSHDIYVGRIGSFYVSGSYFHHANIGHLIKSRAALSQIYYNMIADGNDAASKASYEIDIPDGGQAIIVGNIIQKSSTPENPYVINFARESSTQYAVNRIFICFNTIINFHNASDMVLGAPSSVTEKYIFNNAISENTTFNPSIQLTAEKGNVFFKSEELSLSNYYPASSTVVENWKSLMEKDIDAYLPQDLKSKSISLVPRYQILPSLEIVQLDDEPFIPGAVQKILVVM
ncbi:MAG: hypothetical protein LBC68_06060 [Prevotellaceae bacterium]|jgi:hypothetical protein|nr:hypothetical protein [Prevotellaceae bacterium]